MKRAPGPDDQCGTEMLRMALQLSLHEGYFLYRWKVQELDSLPKPGKPLEDTVPYRPICLLDTLGKLALRIIINMLTQCMKGNRGLSRRQFGF